MTGELSEINPDALLADRLEEPTPRIGVQLMQESNRYLDLPSLAVFLGVSTKTVTRMVDRGDLPQPERIGRLCRWNAAMVERFLGQRSFSTAASFAVPVVYPNDPSKQCELVSRVRDAVAKVGRETLLAFTEGTDASCQSNP